MATITIRDVFQSYRDNRLTVLRNGDVNISGQRQRVDIGRAIVREPDDFLFFAQSSTGYMTQDQIEAMSLPA